jgi:SAM-dependent methyltransferase
MRRTLNIALAVAIVLVGVFLFWLDRDFGRPASAPIPAAAPVRYANEITIRNLTKDTLTYTVTPVGALNVRSLKIIRAGGLDKIAEPAALLLSYWQGNTEKIQVLNSGMPYCFRYDENDKVQVYPGSHMREDVQDLAPYVPTPDVVAGKMLDMAKVGRSDMVYDLGCGDGRIVILAAQKYGARGVGVDIDPQRIEEAEAAALKAGVETSVSFKVQDAMKVDLRRATVVTLYLLPESNALLRPLLESQLKPGSRVISHNYPIPGWEDKRVDSTTVKDPASEEHTIFLYRR